MVRRSNEGGLPHSAREQGKVNELRRQIRTVTYTITDRIRRPARPEESVVT